MTQAMINFLVQKHVFSRFFVRATFLIYGWIYPTRQYHCKCDLPLCFSKKQGKEFPKSTGTRTINQKEEGYLRDLGDRI